MTKIPVTLQISLAPSDFAHAQYLLTHQIRVWREQVSEILLTIDLHRSAGRFSERWEEGRVNLHNLIQSIEGVRVLEVDYGADSQQDVAKLFFGGRMPAPAKDFRGGPFYSYFFALSAATHDHVLHVDSDMFFGGLWPLWLNEALADQMSHPKVLFSAPLPRPPRTDEKLISQSAMIVAGQPHTYNFDTMSTRIFMMSRSRFQSTIGKLHTRHPSARNTIKALIEGNPPQDLPEHLFSCAMREQGLLRREFLGSGAGMWHLHPPYRCADFYKKIPGLIIRCEAGNIPSPQRGDHDINDSLVDWSEARTALSHNRWWRRLLTRISK